MLGRNIAARLKRSARSVLLLGPRQVGKSTLGRSLHPRLVVNLADEETFLSYAKDSGRFRREIAAVKGPGLVMIDEVQRLPAILNTVQAILDEGKGLRFFLTGSSARKLKRGGANLLPGRVILEHLDPLSIRELGSDFDLDRALRVGMLPGVYLDRAEGEDILETYTATYLREEIQAEALSKNLGAYARFLDMAAASSGQWINYSKLSSDAEIPKETIRRFYSILEETLLAVRLPPFRPRRSERRVSQRDRFLLFDVGVRNAILGLHKGPLSPPESGTLFEQWFILQCLYLLRADKRPWSLSSYRTDAGAEVDLVVDAGRKLLAIECKYGANISPAQLGGLRSFEEVAHKPVEKFVAYRGRSRQKFPGGIAAVPYLELLSEISGM